MTGTPAYFVNGRMLSGARPIESFEELIDAELAARKASNFFLDITARTATLKGARREGRRRW